MMVLFKLLGMNLIGITAKLVAHSQLKSKTRITQPNGSKTLFTAMVRIQSIGMIRLALLAALAIFQ